MKKRYIYRIISWILGIGGFLFACITVFCKGELIDKFLKIEGGLMLFALAAFLIINEEYIL